MSFQEKSTFNEVNNFNYVSNLFAEREPLRTLKSLIPYQEVSVKSRISYPGEDNLQITMRSLEKEIQINSTA